MEMMDIQIELCEGIYVTTVKGQAKKWQTIQQVSSPLDRR